MRTCSVVSCESPHFGRGYCNKHYKRWRKTENPLVARNYGADMSGQRFGRLTVIARSDEPSTDPKWTARCECGVITTVRANKLRSGHTRSCGCFRAETIGALRRQEVVDYAGAHDRVKVARGPAKLHPCVDCGARARDWSYDQLDPGELIAQNDHGRGCAYSLNVSHYQPRCKPCHAAFDAPSRKVS